MTINFVLNKQAFAKPYFPISSQGLMYFATSTEQFLSDLFSGSEAWERQLFSAPTAKAISSGTLATPTQLLHTVTSQSGSADDLDSIPAVNNTGLILKATAGHTITIRSNVGNIRTLTNNPVILSGNRIVKLWCDNGQWSVLATRNTYNNLTATSDPSSYDDINDGYSVGSIWVNTVLDRAWLCYGATVSNAVWKPLTKWNKGWSLRAVDNTVAGIGCNASASSPSGSLANANDAIDTWLQLTTNTIVGSFGYVYGGGDTGVIRSSQNAYAEFTIKTGSDITGLRYWLGFGENTSGPASDNDTLLSGNLYAGFRYSTVAGDTGWRPVLHNGTNQTTAAALPVAMAANTEYRFRIRFDHANNTVYFSVNDCAESVQSTFYPANTSDLAAYLVLYTQSGAKTFLFSNLKVAY